MESMRFPPWCKPTLADLLGVFLVAAVVGIGGHRLFGDSDPAMHVATGEFVLEHREVPGADPFSGTRPGGEWFAHEWLADIGWALVHGVAGWTGLLALSACLIAATHVLLYRFLIRRGSDAVVAFGATVAAAVLASSHWLARPHLLSALLLVVFVATIETVVHGGASSLRLAALPPLLALWVNLHGGFLLGLFTLACYVAGSLFHSRHRAVAWPLTLALVGASAATFVNPYGWKLPVHLLSYFASPRAELQRNEEFAAASFTDRAGLALLGFLVLCLLALACAAFAMQRRVEPGEVRLHPGALLAFGASTGMALLSIRHVEVMAIFGALVLADGFSSLLGGAFGQDARRGLKALRGYEVAHGGALFLGVVVALAALASRGWPPGAGYDASRFPMEMVAALKEAHVRPQGPVFAPDFWGGYLVLEWPVAKVFVDGRSDMYGDEFMERYAAIYTARLGWQRALEDAGVDWAVLPHDAPIGKVMEADPAWTRWGSDSTTVVFRRLRAGRGG